MKIGDRARFVLAHDIEAIIIGEANSVNAGHEYQVAWIDNGERKVAWVAECEIEGVGNDCRKLISEAEGGRTSNKL